MKKVVELIQSHLYLYLEAPTAMRAGCLLFVFDFDEIRLMLVIALRAGQDDPVIGNADVSFDDHGLPPLLSQIPDENGPGQEQNQHPEDAVLEIIRASVFSIILRSAAVH